MPYAAHQTYDYLLSLDLEVTLYRSGSATIGSDYTLPLLQGGTNFHSITIPAGSNTFELPFQVVDDASSEGPETVTLTLAEGTNSASYLVTSLGEATITMLAHRRKQSAIPARSKVAARIPLEVTATVGTFEKWRGLFRTQPTSPKN